LVSVNDVLSELYSTDRQVHYCGKYIIIKFSTQTLFLNWAKNEITAVLHKLYGNFTKARKVIDHSPYAAAP